MANQDDMRRQWREQLSFLDNPLQTSGDRILDKELTVRLLWAIYYQANAADQREEDDPDYCAQPWQDSSMVSDVCNPISNIMIALGAEHMDNAMGESGEYMCGLKAPNKLRLISILDDIQAGITADWLCVSEEDYLRSTEGRKGVNLYLAWDGSRALKVDVAGSDLAFGSSSWKSFQEERKGWHFMKAELFEAPADESKGEEEIKGMAQVICDLFAKIKAGGSQCQ